MDDKRWLAKKNRSVRRRSLSRESKWCNEANDNRDQSNIGWVHRRSRKETKSEESGRKTTGGSLSSMYAYRSVQATSLLIAPIDASNFARLISLSLVNSAVLRSVNVKRR